MPELAIELAAARDSLNQWFSLGIDYVESPDFFERWILHEAVQHFLKLRIRGRASVIVTQIYIYVALCNADVSEYNPIYAAGFVENCRSIEQDRALWYPKPV
jgi:hypothetical protein